MDTAARSIWIPDRRRSPAVRLRITLPAADSSNESEGYGGAVYWCGSSQGMQINNDAFTGNQAGGDYYGQGGAIDTCEPFSGSNDTFTSNAAFGNGSAQISSGEAEGGAVYDDDGMNLSNCTFKGNVSTGSEEGYGGAVYIDDPSTITSSTFTSNSGDRNRLDGRGFVRLWRRDLQRQRRRPLEHNLHVERRECEGRGRLRGIRRRDL